MTTDWLARAKAEIAQTRREATDETDRTPVSSVLAVPTSSAPKKREALSSVSSVGVRHESKKQHLRLVINRCCDVRGDDDKNRAELLVEACETEPRLMDDLIDHFEQETLRWKRATGAAETDDGMNPIHPQEPT